MTRQVQAPTIVVMTITTGRRRRMSQAITRACIRRAETARYRGVTMRDLCEAAKVSERRVRLAFDECYGTSPTAYLRTAALRAVRRILLDAPPQRDAVTRAAIDYGFEHLSRFAGHYRALFGEPPSTTLLRARASMRTLDGRSVPLPVADHATRELVGV